MGGAISDTVWLRGLEHEPSIQSVRRVQAESIQARLASLCAKVTELIWWLLFIFNIEPQVYENDMFQFQFAHPERGDLIAALLFVMKNAKKAIFVPTVQNKVCLLFFRDIWTPLSRSDNMSYFAFALLVCSAGTWALPGQNTSCSTKCPQGWFCPGTGEKHGKIEAYICLFRNLNFH